MSDAQAFPAAPRFFAPWRAFAAYLRRPEWREPGSLREAGAWRTWSALWLLDIVGLIVLLVVLTIYMKVTGLPGPDAFDQVPREWLVPLVVLAAPLIEEAVFRGWLAGRPRAMVLLAGLAVLALAATMLPEGSVLKMALVGAALLAMPVGWVLLRKRPAPGWFVSAFPLLFWLTALVFGLVHLSNYPSPGILALPLVLPQVWAGLVFGYTRMRLGLAASMLAHAGANLLAIAPTMLGF
ncbi:CPBP family intramembrane metalloprotease [Novosphingobium sp. MW5]|nr:CPBP family intramembrane metalloprotease [Novosphingobium sp. MW5]